MSKITMGNDEFILYIRKKDTECNITNKDLGRKIWEWLDNKKINAKQIVEDQRCIWEREGESIAPKKLPKTATQFEFDRKVLPELYDYLDTL